ncbi:UNVERIFIED_CONTAM: hypothetical protein Sangu_3221900 [Sesamum angustifolium]|uniref:Uncharacterized protein n=1 Tax=Sesamum angustifolium TaxID=2727405 RepID=A0AAW2JKR9_9LAMI
MTIPSKPLESTIRQRNCRAIPPRKVIHKKDPAPSTGTLYYRESPITALEMELDTIGYGQMIAEVSRLRNNP